MVFFFVKLKRKVEAMSGVGSMIRHLGREEGIKEGKTEGLKALVK